MRIERKSFLKFSKGGKEVVQAEQKVVKLEESKQVVDTAISKNNLLYNHIIKWFSDEMVINIELNAMNFLLEHSEAYI